MICNICNDNYEGHPNSKYCSIKCKKIAKSKINLKYNSKIKNNKQILLDNNILENEIWKPVNIKNFEHYFISNYGRVKSNIRQGGGGFLKHFLSNKGYYMVALRNKDINNKPQKFFVHRLIALSFIDNPKNYPIIDHINRIRTDNRIENLRWCSYSINNQNKNIKGCVCKTIDKVKMKDGTIKEYNYYRVFFNKKSKRFKTEEEANNYLISLKM